MSPPEQPKAPMDQPINVIHYLFILFDTKWIILGVAITCGVLMAQYARTLPEIYKAIVKVDIVEPGDPGGLDPDNRNGAESADLIETGFTLVAAKDNYAKVVLARMRSRKFTNYFLEKHNIYALIYPKHWDSKNQQWRPGFTLDKGEAFIIFGEKFRSIVQDEETDVVNVGMKHTDPLLAAELANLYVEEFNLYTKNIELAEINAKLDFLKSKLVNTRFIQTEQMLYRLIEVQEAAATIAKGEDNFALTVLDPATRVYDRDSPNRKKMVIAATMGSGFLTMFGILGLAILAQVKATLDAYGKSHGRKALIERRWSLRGILLRSGLGILRMLKRSVKPKQRDEA